MLQQQCHVHDINSDVDYRLLGSDADDDHRVYITPQDESPEAMEECVKSLERHGRPSPSHNMSSTSSPWLKPSYPRRLTA